MSLMYITEYAAALGAGAIQVPQEPPLTVQEIDFTAGSTASAALNSGTRFVSIQLDANGYIQFGTNPTAINTAGSRTSRLHEANAVSFHGASGSLKIAAIDAA